MLHCCSEISRQKNHRVTIDQFALALMKDSVRYGWLPWQRTFNENMNKSNHDRSSVIWQKITDTENVNALKVVDRIDLTKFKNARTWLNVNAALRPDYVRNKESPMFLRKISLKIACRLAIKIETVSGPCNTCFCSASWRISYRRRSSVSKTRILWARDRFYIYQSDLFECSANVRALNCIFCRRD